MEKYHFKTSISIEEETGDFLALYFQIRDGKSARQAEFANGNLIADYDSRGRLLGQVWGQTAGSPRTVDNFVGQLRKRLEEDPEKPRHFITVRGSGYRFDP